MRSNDEQDKEEPLSWLDDKEDPFGLKEEIETITFKCVDCHKTDEVPDFVVDDFAYDKEKGEQVEVVCPFCDGTMQIAKDVSKD
ncbi:hypothetical protein MM221_10390 [Salipaludibacillus sp. LMS25]|jgi:hypothetical protein|uniref:hypothetical protein n=1 Tax=Salipaludibacillus sp. LMS25 TaxID=2924031 RepID=UPI0020D03B22|nr:hypothetical protein [Salipaludibacillus sp. LMS25]UTR14299.1 hypothetical protein MM221_17300 [Salipaludibacillus sp. LMS25]UTR16877.1 hypothetical protein MM221_10390 [Salipaludibacillus sp. LMS25]